MSAALMNFDPVLRRLASPLPVMVFDTVGCYQDGQWIESEPLPRPHPLQAVVLAMPRDRLQFNREGDASAAGITLHTRETLYFTDVLGDGQQTRQSYVDYQGYRFRVCGTGFLLGNAGLNLYEAIRSLH